MRPIFPAALCTDQSRPPQSHRNRDLSKRYRFLYPRSINQKKSNRPILWYTSGGSHTEMPPSVIPDTAFCIDGRSNRSPHKKSHDAVNVQTRYHRLPVNP
jgi:hypothetical protein